MLGQKKKTHLSRYYQIADVLARHGLGYLISVFDLERFVPFRQELFHRSKSHTPPEHVRLAFEELGPAFIKLGQLLSTRSDMLPPEYLAELSKLQDQAPPIPTDLVEETLNLELGKPINEVYATFDLKPLAAASIGQVHAATLPDGTEVVVKVRRPGIITQVAEDLDILVNLASIASRRWKVAESYDLVGLTQEFAQTLQLELDYLREGRNAEKFAENFAEKPFIHIPKVFWESTTSGILTLERIHGIKISDIEALDAAKIDRKKLAERSTEAILKMFYEDGYFHADLHPGNFFIEEDNRIGLVDFGMVGNLDKQTKELMVRFLLAITSQNSDRLVDVFIELGVTRKRVNRDSLRRDLDHLLAPYYNLTISEIQLDKLLEEALTIIRRHNLQLPSNLMLLLKTFLMAEGMGKQLSPNFEMMKIIIPYSKRLLLQQYSPTTWFNRLSQASLDAARLGVEFPNQLYRLIGEIERGNLEIGMKPADYEPVMNRLDRLANRIVTGIVTAGLIIGLAIILTFYRPQEWDQLAGFLFIFGIIITIGLSLYLAWNIFRTGRL